jgi:hypothetical protein
MANASSLLLSLAGISADYTRQVFSTAPVAVRPRTANRGNHFGGCVHGRIELARYGVRCLHEPHSRVFIWRLARPMLEYAGLLYGTSGLYVHKWLDNCSLQELKSARGLEQLCELR